MSAPHHLQRLPMVSDERVLAAVPADSTIVFHIAAAVGSDVFDVEACLRRLADKGSVVRHPSRPGVPVMWSTPGS